MIGLSLNEAETLAAKAARGAGYSWGQADDIGQAARGLAAEGGDFGAALLRLLRGRDGFAPPVPERLALWRRGEPDIAAARPLCPILTATWLLDSGLDPVGFRLLHVGLPIWLDAMLRRAGLGAACDDLLGEAGDVTLMRREVSSQAQRRAAVGPEIWRALGEYAALTYVPESDSSRRRGAGGGRVDDD